MDLKEGKVGVCWSVWKKGKVYNYIIIPKI